MSSVSLGWPHPGVWSLGEGVGWGRASESKLGDRGPRHSGPFVALTPEAPSCGPYLKQWAAVRIQCGSRMLPPQMCCLSYWMLTCQGQESTEAVSPPTTRGTFRLFPQAGLSSKEGKSRSQTLASGDCLPSEPPVYPEQGP